MSATVDLTYFGKGDKRTVRDQVTPFKIAIVVLIDEYLSPNNDVDVEDVDRRDYTEKQESNMMLLILRLVQGADMDLKDLYLMIEEADCGHVISNIKKKMNALHDEGVSALMGLLQDIPEQMFDDPNPYLQKSSVIGQYLRRIHLAFDKLTFGQVTKLHSRYKTFYDTWTNNTRGSKFSIYGKSQDSEFDISDQNESVDISIAKSEKEDEFEHDHCEGKYSQRQAELFIAQQSAMLQHNELEALPPQQLQQNIQELLKTNPDLAEAHFLSYMNNLRINEYVGAVDSLFHYFDQKLMITNPTPNAAKDKPEDEEDLNFRYGALNLALLHHRFGHNSEALSCVQEAIKLAQEFNDHICLQHALGWLQILGVQSGDNSEHLLQRLITKTGELNMPYLMSLGIQAFARHIAIAKSVPSHVFDLMIRSDIFNYQHFHTRLVCSSLAQKSALWHRYGKREMCSLNSQILLNLETGKMGMYHNDEAECLALCQLATLHGDQGLYAVAFSIIDSAKRRFPCNTQYAHIWTLQEQILIFRRAILHGKWDIAEQSVLSMKAIDATEASYSRCILLKEKGEISTAFESTLEMLETFRSKKSETIQDVEVLTRLLILQAELFCATSNATAASRPLLECITLAKEHHLAHVQAVATLHLAFVQLCLDLPQHGLELIHSVLVTILAQGTLAERAKAYYLKVKCQVAAHNKHYAASKSNKTLSEAFKTMNEVIEWFKSVEDHHRTKDAYYYQAKLCDQLGFKYERNRCAFQFRMLDQQYPTWHKGQVLRL